MDLNEYRQRLEQISYGKRLPSALYLYRDGAASFGKELDDLVVKLIGGYHISAAHNAIKFRLDELKISFLEYPDFLDCPHPSLYHSVTIDLVTGKHREMDYSGNINPPILHRKESLVPPDHPRRSEFEALTQTEEAEGLFQDTTTIGFKQNWERLLLAKGLVLQGHQLCRRKTGPLSRGCSAARNVERHRTALTRYDLSKPVKTLFEYGLLAPSSTFFDYGCGQGSDVAGLQSLGYQSDGWDPVFRGQAPKAPADFVNLGYVLNVIEDPAERLEALCNAYRLTRRVLIVSTLIQQTIDASMGERFRDGVLTKRNTFQKYFGQQELHQYIEDALETTAVPVALGVFYVFRDPAEQQDFLSARTRHPVEWGEISSRLGLGRPVQRQQRVRVDLYEKNKDLLDAFWATMLQLGRQPLPEEFPRIRELRQDFGSPQKAERLFLEKGGKDVSETARESRRNDLLVHLALSNFRRPVPYRYLSRSLQQDIRSFFGSFQQALSVSRKLLFAAGDPHQIELASKGSQLGWQTEQAIYFHRSLLERLPPLLRVYVGCASLLYGDIHQADIVKIHKASGKVTLLIYDDFSGENLPELRQRIKVNLRSGLVQVFDHVGSGQLLYFKERYLGPDYPDVNRLIEFSTKLRKLGISDEVGFGPSKTELAALIKQMDLNES